MSTRSRLAVLAGCAVVALLLAWYAGARQPPTTTSPVGAVRLGPEAGEDVAAYLARLPATLPPDGTRAPALVQFAAGTTGPAALDAVAGTTPRTAVFRLPLPRVQTALRFVDVEPDVAAPAALDNARVRAARAAETDAARLTGRPGAVAAAEAAGLAEPGCPCVLALLVEGDGAALRQVTTRAGVRAVEAAAPGTVDPALSPLLPEQEVRVTPPPDDGPVPTGGSVPSG